MTKNELNKIRAAAYAAAVENPEVAEKIAVTGYCSIYTISDFKQTQVWVVDYETQINSYTLSERGFDPDKVEIHREMYLEGKTKCATF